VQALLDLLGELHSAAEELDGILRANDSAQMSLVREANKMMTCSKGWRLSSKDAPRSTSHTAANAGA